MIRAGCATSLAANDTTFASVFGRTLGAPRGLRRSLHCRDRHCPACSFINEHATKVADSAVIADPAASAPFPPAPPAPSPPPTTMPSSGCTSTRPCRRTVAGVGAAKAAGNYGFGPSGAPRSSVQRASASPGVSRPRLHFTVAMGPARVPTSCSNVCPHDTRSVKP